MGKTIGVVVDTALVVIAAAIALQLLNLSPTDHNFNSVVVALQSITWNSIYTSFHVLCDKMETKTFFIHEYMPHVKVLDFFSSLLICRMYRSSAKEAKSWIEALVACAVFKFGGTTISGLVL